MAVFKLPRDNSTDYIKRVIGMPGDEIAVRDGVLYINGQAVPKVRKDDFVSPEEGRPIARFEETLPNGVKYLVLDWSRAASSTMSAVTRCRPATTS